MAELAVVAVACLAALAMLTLAFSWQLRHLRSENRRLVASLLAKQAGSDAVAAAVYTSLEPEQDPRKTLHDRERERKGPRPLGL